MNPQHRRFVFGIAVIFSATLLPILVLNFILLSGSLGNNRKALLASQWQQQTHGVTYAPTLLDSHLFKTLRLNDRMAEINTVVLGSSTAFGVSQLAFPEKLRIYNYAQSDNSLSAVVNEASWLVERTDNIQYLVVPIDWSLGWIFEEDAPVSVDLSAASTLNQAESANLPVSLSDRIGDALSYPRIINLLEIIKNMLTAENSVNSFRSYFFRESGDEYLCSEGVLAKDFDIDHRGACAGFRFDGSATFANMERVQDALPLITSATMSNSAYVHRLIKGKGWPNPDILYRLSVLSKQLGRKGGKLILFMPPLLPGMEDAFVKHPVWSQLILQTKRILHKWAIRENIVIIDAGQSERFGCNADEFVDQHHALSTCYDKIFKGFWKAYPFTSDGEAAWRSGGLY